MRLSADTLDYNNANSHRGGSGVVGVQYLTPANQGFMLDKLLPVTHILVGTWMLTFKPVYKVKNVFDALKWTTYIHVTPFTLTSKA